MAISGIAIIVRSVTTRQDGAVHDAYSAAHGDAVGPA